MAGRPLKFTDVNALQVQIEEYFALTDARKKPYTLAGLAYHLDCCTETLRLYGEKEAFFATIKKAKQRCEVDLCENMIDKEKSTAGCIFQAVNNHGYINNTSKVDSTSSDGSMSPKPMDDRELAIRAAMLMQEQMGKK